MIPQFCQIKHNPENGKYGDCLRACVASLLEFDMRDVPHFADGGDPKLCEDKLREFTKSCGLRPFYSAYEGDPLPMLLAFMTRYNTDVNFILHGSIDGADHVAIYCNDKKVHDPAWYSVPFDGPTQSGFWFVLVFVPL